MEKLRKSSGNRIKCHWCHIDEKLNSFIISYRTLALIFGAAAALGYVYPAVQEPFAIVLGER